MSENECAYSDMPDDVKDLAKLNSAISYLDREISRLNASESVRYNSLVHCNGCKSLEMKVNKIAKFLDIEDEL